MIKTRLKISILSVLVLFLCIVMAHAFGDNQMSVQVRKGKLRDKPSFLGKIIAKLEYGTHVTIQKENKGWRRVRLNNSRQSGWMHISALSEKEIKLKASHQDVKIAASNDEVALAGKGFNKQVETEYKSRNKNISFKWVDKMEKTNVSPKQVQQFIKTGQLQPKEDTR